VRRVSAGPTQGRRVDRDHDDDDDTDHVVDDGGPRGTDDHDRSEEGAGDAVDNPCQAEQRDRGYRSCCHDAADNGLAG
jgi:hypothetical protein